MPHLTCFRAAPVTALPGHFLFQASLAAAFAGLGASLSMAAGICRPRFAPVALHWPTQPPPPLKETIPWLWIVGLKGCGPASSLVLQAPVEL